MKSRSSAVSFASGKITLRGEAWGRAADPPVLLLHGGGQTRFAWGGTAEALAREGFYALAIDARGHGESDWAEGPDYHLHDFVGDLLAITPQLARRPAVVGASLGGITALVATLGGLEPWALVLVDIAPHVQREGVERIHRFMTARPNGFADLEEAADAVAQYLPHRERPRNLQGLEKNLRLGDDGRWRWHWDPRFIDRIGDPESGFEEAERAARALTAPTLLVRGQQSDLLSEEDAAQFLEMAPHARQVDVSGARHMVAGDRNDPFTHAVVTFLLEHRESGAGSPPNAIDPRPPAS